jgi:hypothetical protein
VQVNHALLHKFMSDLAKCDAEVLRPWFTETSVLWMPPSEPVTGTRRIVTMFKLIFRMYSELHWKVAEVHELAPGRFMYLTDSWGKIGADTPYKNNICTLIEFDSDGRIKFLSDYFKNTAIFDSGKLKP